MSQNIEVHAIAKLAIFYLIAISIIAFALFLGEGVLLYRKSQPEKIRNNQE